MISRFALAGWESIGVRRLGSRVGFEACVSSPALSEHPSQTLKAKDVLPGLSLGSSLGIPGANMEPKTETYCSFQRGALFFHSLN